MRSRFNQFKAVGFESVGPDNLQALSAEGSSGESIEQQLGEGRIVIFPCRWEASGSLLVRSLSLGCTVLARRSAALLELADHYRGPGALVPFEGTLDLVRSLGAVLHGDPVSLLAFGTSLGGGAPQPSWRKFGEDLLRLFEERMNASADGSWVSRESFFRGVAADTVDYPLASRRRR